MSIPVNVERVTQAKVNLKMISDNDKNFKDVIKEDMDNPAEYDIEKANVYVS